MSDKPIEAEVLEQSQALAIRHAQAVGLFGTSEPVQVIERATVVASALKDVLRKQGLISNISGKEYPKCEAWTLLGTMLGVFPVLEWCRAVEGGWEARVLAKTKDGATVGAAEAECLRSEKNWQNREDFALRSMAQTRATAKCLRMPLGFVMTLAGYEATPAEEMTFDRVKPAPKAPQPSRPPSTTSPPIKTPPTPAKAQPQRFPTDKTRAWMIKELKAGQGQECRAIVTEYFHKVPQLLETEQIEDLPRRYVPVSKKQLEDLVKRIGDFEAGGDAEPAFPPNPEEPPAETKAAIPPKSKADEAWRDFPMPFGKHAGERLEDLEKNYLFGLWANYTVETEFRGKPKKPETIAKDETLRAMLDLAGKHYQFTKAEERE